jgi:RNA polymerase sigma-70 factor (ECF subfamily)
LRSRREHVELDERLASEEKDPFGNCRDLEIICRVRRAVASLSLEQRQVISLVDLEEFSYCDVAGILDVPIGTVMSRLHRARKNLLAKLEATTPGSASGRDHIRIVK